MNDFYDVGFRFTQPDSARYPVSYSYQDTVQGLASQATDRLRGFDFADFLAWAEDRKAPTQSVADFLNQFYTTRPEDAVARVNSDNNQWRELAIPFYDERSQPERFERLGTVGGVKVVGDNQMFKNAGAYYASPNVALKSPYGTTIPGSHQMLDHEVQHSQNDRGFYPYTISGSLDYWSLQNEANDAKEELDLILQGFDDRPEAQAIDGEIAQLKGAMLTESDPNGRLRLQRRINDLEMSKTEMLFADPRYQQLTDLVSQASDEYWRNWDERSARIASTEKAYQNSSIPFPEDTKPSRTREEQVFLNSLFRRLGDTQHIKAVPYGR
jgi:hypothetical protein